MPSSKLDSLREALAHSPENLPLLQLYAEACLEEFQLGDARETFEKMLAVAPLNPDGKLGIARVVHLQGQASEAVVRLEQLLSEHPEHAPAYVALSRMLLGEGDASRARDLYAKALKLEPSVADEALEKELAETPASSEPPPRRAGLSSQGDFIEDADDFDDDDSDSEPLGGTAYDLGLTEMGKPKLSFNDVGGMEALKEQIRMKIIYPLQHAELFRAYDKKIGGGVLLYGPPGCGKTMISKATAGEVKANFISLGLHQILDMWIGNSEKHMHEVFEMARKHAPCVLFFDEVDALAADRKDLRQSAGRTLINQFLAEMDGAEGDNDGVLIIGATNAPWHIDNAFRRPGRFDRTIFVPPPDDPARAAIIEVMSRKKPIADLDPDALAKKCDGFSGADLKAVFDLATEEVLADAMKTGKVVPLTTKSLAKAAKKHRPTTKAWFESAKNYALYANQGGHYDEVLQYLGLVK
jgi:SpoVK/Ycf46/Vps4 family AAA+-type ATPase